MGPCNYERRPVHLCFDIAKSEVRLAAQWKASDWHTRFELRGPCVAFVILSLGAYAVKSYRCGRSLRGSKGLRKQEYRYEMPW